MIPFAFYASLSDMVPALGYSLDQHQRTVFRRGTTLPLGTSLSAYANDFFRRNSGLVPASSYTDLEHATAYFESFGFPTAWETELIDNYVLLVGEEPSDTFTANFEATF